MSIAEKRVTELPSTRHSLLRRVKNPRDGDAWREFLKIYQPVVYRYARRKGLQPADAEDLVQKVFVAAGEKLRCWDNDRSNGSFRAWILLVTRNAVINALSRRSTDQPVGGDGVGNPLDELSGTETDVELDQEYRRATFRRAADFIRDEFAETTWQAFWETAVEGTPINDVSRKLDVSIGTVYAARSRIMKRLREVVSQIEREENE